MLSGAPEVNIKKKKGYHFLHVQTSVGVSTFSLEGRTIIGGVGQFGWAEYIKYARDCPPSSGCMW